MLQHTIVAWLSSGAPIAQAVEGDMLSGPYVSIIKWGVMLAMIMPWLYLAPMAHKDAVRVRAQAEFWALIILGAGLLGLFVWMLVPAFAVGLLIYAVLVAATFLAYVVYRNGRVPEDAKILTAEHIKSMLSGAGHGKLEVTTKLKLYAKGNTIVLPPTVENSEPDEIRAYNLTQELLYDMIWHRSSEARISPKADQTRVHYVIDGVVSERSTMSIADSEAIIQFLKPIGGMEADDVRKPQNGKISVDMGEKPIDIELATTGTTGGQEMRFRLVQEVVQTDVEQLGMTKDVLERVRAFNTESSGLIIISGQPGSGVTSTLYSLIREHDAFMKQIVSLEPTAAVDLENITQYAYGEPEKLMAQLAGAIRREPDVMIVDGCQDPKAMQVIQEAAAEKLILLGIRASDSFTALAKWVKGVAHAELAMTNLKAVICQRLFRKLCPTCREPYQPDPMLLAKINIPADQAEQFCRPHVGPLTDEKGKPYMCPTCQGTGYFGRTAVFELMNVTDEIRQLVAGGTSLSRIKATCRKNKMLYLQEQALRKAMDGTTSVQEVIRVTEPAKKRKPQRQE